MTKDVEMVPDRTIEKLKSIIKGKQCNFRYKKQGHRQYITTIPKGGNHISNMTTRTEVNKILNDNLSICRETSSFGGEVTYRINGDPIKQTLIEKIDTTLEAKPNRFGQIPEVGDYAIGIRSADSRIFIVEVMGWNEKSLIVQPLISTETSENWDGKKKIEDHTKPTTMRWKDNVIIPKDAFGEDFNEFLVMFKLSMALPED